IAGVFPTSTFATSAEAPLAPARYADDPCPSASTEPSLKLENNSCDASAFSSATYPGVREPYSPLTWNGSLNGKSGEFVIPLTQIWLAASSATRVAQSSQLPPR